MFKKYAWIIVIVVFLAIILIAVRGKEDTWLCQNSIWVKHGNPTGAVPTYFCDK